MTNGGPVVNPLDPRCRWLNFALPANWAANFCRAEKASQPYEGLFERIIGGPAGIMIALPAYGSGDLTHRERLTTDGAMRDEGTPASLLKADQRA